MSTETSTNKLPKSKFSGSFATNIGFNAPRFPFMCGTYQTVVTSNYQRTKCLAQKRQITLAAVKTSMDRSTKLAKPDILSVGHYVRSLIETQKTPKSNHLKIQLMVLQLLNMIDYNFSMNNWRYKQFIFGVINSSINKHLQHLTGESTCCKKWHFRFTHQLGRHQCWPSQYQHHQKKTT